MEASFRAKLEGFVAECDEGARAQAERMIRENERAGGTSFERTLGLCVAPDVAANVRSTACWVLGRIADPGAVPVLVQALDDGDPGVRREAVASLASIGDPAAVPRLLRAFQSDRETSVRKSAVNALWLLGGPAAFEPIVATLLDSGEAPELRSDCADALAQMADCGDLDEPQRKAALDALLTALRDGSAEVRYFAAFALGMLRDPAALVALKQTAATDDGTAPRWGSVSDEAMEAVQLIEKSTKRR
jgi:HEAT repeat protein